MDIDLDLISGFEILAFIKNNLELEFPVYILTKTKREEDVLKTKPLRVKEFFQKPLNYEAWKEMVGDICRESFG